MLIRRAEGEAASTKDDLQVELEKLYKRLREEFAPLAFFYDLRVHGGLAHNPNMKEAAKAAGALGLPGSGWHRTHYLSLVNLVTGSVSQICEHLRNGAVRLRT